MNLLKRKKNIRVISIEGEIKAKNTSMINKQSESQLDLLEKLYTIEIDDNIYGVLLRIDSPGGAAGTSEEVYQAIKAIATKKPVVASIGNTGCSGAYMIACAADYIMATKMAIVGSVGVIMQIPNVSKVKEKIGIDMITIKSGKMKDIGNMFRDMSEEERAFIQTLSNECHQDFIDLVKNSRGDKLQEGADELLDGRILSPATALKYGLIDGIGTYTDALRLLCQKLDTKLEKVKLIHDKKKDGFINKFIDLSMESIAGNMIATLLENHSQKYFK